MINVLVTGAAGQLGSELCRIADDYAGSYDFYFADISGDGFVGLDITDEGSLNRFVSENDIGVIINCAAYTAVDKAESDEEAAYAINADGARNLARCAEKAGAEFVHISTDYVFDGHASKPYTENSPTAPQSAYGRSKLEGERAIRESGCRGVIIRTSWLYSSFGGNFVKTMIRLGSQRDSIGVVADQYGSPTYAADLAKAIMYILPQLPQTPRYGEIYHFCDGGSTTWFGLATRIMQLAGLDCKVEPLTTEQYPTPACRPAYSVMDTSKITRDFGVAVPAWEMSLEECIKLIEI